MRINSLGFFIVGAMAMALFMEGFYLGAAALVIAAGFLAGLLENSP